MAGDFTLSLGGVEFQGWEIPEEIRAGGAQLLEIHKYAGGERTIDAFGADDAPITWSGIFRDQTAESRCQQIDAMRKAGAPVDLSWSSFSYQVIIASFTWSYQRFYQIAYEITLEVVSDNTQPVTDDSGTDTESDMQDDLSDSNDYSDELDDSQFTSNMDTVNNDVAGLPSISGGTVSLLSTLQDDVATAQGRAGTLTDAYDPEVDQYGAAGNFAGGASPLAMVGTIKSLISSTSGLANSNAATNSLTRLGKNIASLLSG